MRNELQNRQDERLMAAWCETTKAEITLRRQEGDVNGTHCLLDIARLSVQQTAAIVRAAVEGSDDLPGYDELSNDLARELDEVFMRHVNAAGALRQN